VLPAVHSDIVNRLARGPSTGTWLSAAEDRTVVLYDAARHEQLEVWAGHAKGVNAVAPLHAPHGDADALAAVSASRDCTLKLWRRGVREAAATLEGHTLTVSAVCAPSVELVVSAGRDASVRSWDVRSGRQVGVARIARNLATFLAPCGPAEPALVVQGSEDLSVRLWDVRAMAVGSTIERTLQYFALCGAVSADGLYVLVGCNGFSGAGCELRLYDRRRSGALAVVRPHEHAVTACDFLPRAQTGGLVGASASKDGTVAVLDFLRAGVAGGEGEGGGGGLVHRLQLGSVSGQLTALVAVDGVQPPRPRHAATACAPAEPAGGALAAVMVGTPRGSVHTLALDPPTGSLRELCYTAPLPPLDDDDDPGAASPALPA